MVSLEVALHHSQRKFLFHLPRCELGEPLWSRQLICVDQGMGHLWRRPQHLWEQKAPPGPDGWYGKELSCFLLRGKQRGNNIDTVTTIRRYPRAVKNKQNFKKSGKERSHIHMKVPQGQNQKYPRRRNVEQKKSLVGTVLGLIQLIRRAQLRRRNVFSPF